MLIFKKKNLADAELSDAERVLRDHLRFSFKL